jgi:hypothetical protein
VAVRDAGELLWPAVAETLGKLDLGGEDAAVAKLAELYAEVIDELPASAPRGVPDRAWGMRWIAPLLLDALEQLGATPAARSRIKEGRQGDAPVSQLAKLRAARRP